MQHSATAGRAGPAAAMRSGRRLLPSLAAAARRREAGGGGGGGEVAVRPMSAGPSAGAAQAASLPQALQQLRTGVQFELRKGCSNFQGRTRFDSFLVSTLQQLGPQLSLPPDYLQQARAYDELSPERRAALCRELEEVAKSVLAEGSSGSDGSNSSSSRQVASNSSRSQRSSRHQRSSQSSTNGGNGSAAGQAGGEPPAPAAAADASKSAAQRPAARLADDAAAQAGAQAAVQQPAMQQPASESGGQAAGAELSTTQEPAVEAAAMPAPSQAAPAASQEEAAVAPAVVWDEAAMAEAMVEWGLTAEEQLQRPFEPPPLSSLTRPVPVLFDLETNDVFNTCHIIQIGALQAVTGAAFEAQLRLPAHAEMHPAATEATKVTTAQAQRADRAQFADVYPDFYGKLRDEVAAELAGGGPGAYLLLIGHNIRSFDIDRLMRHAAAAQLPSLRHARFLDTLPLARAVFPPSVRGDPGFPVDCSLEKLYEFFTGQKPPNSHDAADDCRSNLVVLEGLLRLLPEVPAGAPLSAQVHAAAMVEASFSGWVEDVIRAAAKPAAKRDRSPRKRAPKPGGPPSLIDQWAAGPTQSLDEELKELMLPDPVARVEAAGLAALEEAGGEEGQEEEEGLEAEAAAAEADSEAELLRPEAVSELTIEQRRAQVAAVQAGWQALVQDTSLRDSFLSTPLTALVKRGTGFTPGQVSKLEEAKVTTLGQLLECYPRRLLASQPGRLPEPTDEDPVVTVAAKFVKPAALRKTNGGAWMLQAKLQVVHPSELGLNVPWVPADAYEDRECYLEIFEFRPAFTTFYALKKEKEKLEESAWGPDSQYLVLSGPVKAAKVDKYTGADTWRFDAGKYQVLPPLQAAAAFVSTDSQLSVEYPARGQVTPALMAGVVEKGMGMAEEAAQRGVPIEPLPDWVLSDYGLLGLLPSLRAVHCPPSEPELEAARQRLAFQEFLALQLKLLVQRNLAWVGGDASGGGAVRIEARSNELLDLAQASLGFELTRGQKRALDDILWQMSGWPPMQCLLQGDVGCGKTAVAFLALLAAAGAGYQGAIMAPTEILAEQHYRSLQALVQRMNREVSRRRLTGFQLPRVALVTGSVKGKARAVLNDALAKGEIDVAVGTHALISESTQFARLGLAVVDEQHKFGVEQRGRLLAKASPAPHVLHMTATPIPRTQALIDHGDMSQVVIQELPAGRSPVKTRAIEDGSPLREEMYEHIRQEMARGHGIYIVYPFVEESDKLTEVKAATREAERLVADGVFAAEDCGLLHGQMPIEDKDRALAAFKEGRTKVLVSTTVIEVGVDVPQATVMVIEHAERFGFAQLHQLRGRVGRSERQSYCYLVYAPGGGPTLKKKMRVLENCSNGFAVAECDLELRGAGEVLGRKQSGRDVRSSFKAARIPGDRELLEAAREAAARLLAQQPDPRDWPPELRALVADESLLQLDTLTMPTLAP